VSWPRMDMRSTISHSESTIPLGDCPGSEKPVTTGADESIRPAQAWRCMEYRTTPFPRNRNTESKPLAHAKVTFGVL
jgi:hypothetical protein